MPITPLTAQQKAILDGFGELTPQARAYYNSWGNRIAEHQPEEGESGIEGCARVAGLKELWDRGLVHAGEVMYGYEQYQPNGVKPDQLMKFRTVVRDLLAAGTYPGHKVLAELGYAYPATRGSGPAMKSGRYTCARRQELLAAGYRFDWDKSRFVKD